MRGKSLIFVIAVLLAVPATTGACNFMAYDLMASSFPGNARAGSAAVGPQVTAAALSGGCPTDANDQDPMTTPDKVITGTFDTSQQGDYVMLPFDVPANTTAVRVRYCYDQPDLKPPSSPVGNTLDLGLYDARPGPTDLWGKDEFRGWGGSSHPDVTVSPNGFSSEADYVAHSRTHVYGKTTRGFEPGPIPAGQWAAELGVASVTSQAQGDSDGKVAWRVEIQYINDPGYADAPYQPATYDTTPANSGPGWYAGDFHVHSEHSDLGATPMSEVFRYAFAPIAPGSGGGAGLDFITLSDYVTDTAWSEIGRYQAAHPGKLIERSTEVITYHGHTNNHGSHTFVDYRTGPIYQRAGNGAMTLMRAATPASRIFDAVHTAGGWTQINHPTIFPSAVPGFSSFCRGCPWDYSDASTDYSKVDAIEVATGPAGLRTSPNPGPNPFTPLAVQFYEHALGTGAHIAAVGSSDSHRAGEAAGNPSDVTGSPVGQATTVVHAQQLSESGLEQAVKAGHTYVKMWGNDGPDLRFEGRPVGANPSDPPAIFGDTVHADTVNYTARVQNLNQARAARPGDYELIIYRNGVPLPTVLPIPPTGDSFEFSFPAPIAGRYRLQVQRNGAIEDVSSPIYQEAASPNPPGDTTAPTAHVRAPEYASDHSRDPSFRVSWGGTDDFAGSGIASYKVQIHRHGGSPGWRTVLAHTRRTSATFRGRPGATYEFRVRAKDRSGNRGAYVSDQTIVPLDDWSRAVGYAGGWHTIQRPGAYLHSLDRSPDGTGRAFLDFKGTRLAIIGTRTTEAISFRVMIDGHSRLVRLPAVQRRDPREVLYRSRRLDPGKHSLTIAVLQGQLELDALAISR